MSKAYGIEEARKILGDLVTAAQYGHSATITRNGRPAARIVPIEEPTMNAQDIAYAVSTTLGDHIDDYDIDAIVEEIRLEYGAIGSIDDVPTDAYWKIVEKHDKSA